MVKSKELKYWVTSPPPRMPHLQDSIFLCCVPIFLSCGFLVILVTEKEWKWNSGSLLNLTYLLICYALGVRFEFLTEIHSGLFSFRVYLSSKSWTPKDNSISGSEQIIWLLKLAQVSEGTSFWLRTSFQIRQAFDSKWLIYKRYILTCNCIWLMIYFQIRQSDIRIFLGFS